MTRNRHEALSKVQGQESLIFQTHVTSSIDFPIHITIISSPMLLIRLISFVILVNESDSPARRLRVSHLLCLCSFGFCV